MNPEQVQQSDKPENAENRNGAIDESGKVDRIRDILFGSQMRDYDGRFQKLDERLTREAAEARSDTQKRLEVLGGEFQRLGRFPQIARQFLNSVPPLRLLGIHAIRE